MQLSLLSSGNNEISKSDLRNILGHDIFLQYVNLVNGATFPLTTGFLGCVVQ